ncbi:MAG: LbtU family siderophore porin [Coxiellaceae bacterium]|nr:LbtU family siderophore porin [Coxiellaceae bacterium]
MKSKFLFIVFLVAFFSNVVFATPASSKKILSKENINQLKTRTLFLEKQVRSLQYEIDNIKSSDKYINSNLDLLVEMYAHGPAVVTSPALGVRRSAEDARDLMVNLPSINEDLVLLNIRKKMDNYVRENNIAIPERPIIALSGVVEGLANVKHNYNRNEKADINLLSAELDVVGEAGSWATAAMIISYEDEKGTVFGTRVNGSRLKINLGFVTIGQLNKFPLYFTIGQVFAPFGSFGSYMITYPATKTLGRFKDRMVVVGLDWKGLSAQVYGFPGEAKMADSHNVLGHTGFNIAFERLVNKFKFNVGGSVIGNLAESNGMQDKIFANTNYGSNTVQKRVCGVDGRLKITYNDMFMISTEYVGAAEKFNQTDLSFNGRGAKPQALHTEAAIDFLIKGKPNAIAVGYGHTWEALALEVPKDYFFAEYNVSLVKSTILSFEYRHDINYNWNDIAMGSKNIASSIDGRHRNIFSASLGIYF